MKVSDSKNKVLVTGYRGYIGSRVFKKLAGLGFDVAGVDLKDGEDILECLPKGEFEFVFHLAALPRVEYSVANPSYTLKQNVLVTSRVLEWAKDHGVKRVIFSSSSAVCGDGTGPLSPYGLHKLMSEMECKLYSELYGLDTVCLRYFNVYSEDQEYGGAYSTVVSAWMELLKRGEPLRVEGDGEQTRDFIHVDDVVEANIFCMNHEDLFKGASLDIGTGKSLSINNVKQAVEKHNAQVEWTYAPGRKGDARGTLADITDIKKLGWRPTVSIDVGLERCFNKGEIK